MLASVLRSIHAQGEVHTDLLRQLLEQSGSRQGACSEAGTATPHSGQVSGG